MLNTLQEKLSSVATETLSKTLGALLAIVLVLLIGSQLLSLFQTITFTPITKTVSTVTKHKPANDYNAMDITQLNLFGQSNIDPNQLIHSNLPTTNLAVTLRGVFTSSDPRQASAIIELSDGNTKSYKVGARIYDQTSLHAVFKDRIVLSTNGALATLHFPTATERDSTTNTAALADRGIPTSVSNLVKDNMSSSEIQQAAQDLSNPSMTQEQRKLIIRERLLELRQRAREKRENNK